MLDLLNQLESRSLSTLQSLLTEESLIQYKNTILGKTGELTMILKWLKDLSAEDRVIVWKRANEVRDSIGEAFDTQKILIKRTIINTRLSNEWEDTTIPFPFIKGSIHPISTVRQEVEATFLRMGFDIHESMEITTEYLNFDAVNVPKNHPARDMQDTFWLEWTRNVLATQTSCMQNLILKSEKTPIKAIIPGRVFRNEDVDATHDNTFYQVEGIVVDKGIHIGHLKFTITTMLSDLFGKEVHIRMRPWYFPFVEPGMEVDFSCPFCDGVGCKICKWSGWIEFTSECYQRMMTRPCSL
jgi:phenylalanyl-tRNA synthetase alpha chain